MFCAPRPILGGTEGIGFGFHVFRYQIRLAGTEGVRSSFHVLRSRTHFGRKRGISGADTLDTAEKESGSAKTSNETRRPQYDTK
jgi:hypothetical protein